MTWKDGGDYGRFSREIVNKEGRGVCFVYTKQVMESIGNSTEPWPEGEEHFVLILNAPMLLEALEAIADKARRMLLSPYAPGGTHCPHKNWADWESVRGNALAAIAAVKGEQADGKA